MQWGKWHFIPSYLMLGWGLFSHWFFQMFNQTGNKTMVAFCCQQSLSLQVFLAHPQHGLGFVDVRRVEPAYDCNVGEKRNPNGFHISTVSKAFCKFLAYSVSTSSLLSLPQHQWRHHYLDTSLGHTHPAFTVQNKHPAPSSHGQHLPAAPGLLLLTCRRQGCFCTLLPGAGTVQHLLGSGFGQSQQCRRDTTAERRSFRNVWVSQHSPRCVQLEVWCPALARKQVLRETGSGFNRLAPTGWNLAARVIQSLGRQSWHMQDLSLLICTHFFFQLER